jgi:hypothetical protein
LGIGWILANAPAASSTVMVKLVPSVASPPTLLEAEAMRHPVKEPEHEHAKRH